MAYESIDKPRTRAEYWDDLAANPPLWARFALDPKSAQLVIDANEGEDNPEAAGQATASDQRTYLLRAALLAEFLEGGPEQKEELVLAAYGFKTAINVADEAYSQIDIPYRQG